MGEASGSGHLFAGSGEMALRMRSMDWSRTPLGPVEGWSPALRTMTSILLANRFPMLLWWGPDSISIYNDAYIPVLGVKHPGALGQPVRECWSEIYDILEPLILTPLHGGPSTWSEDLPLEIRRHGFLEETHWTVAYSPVPDDTTPSGIGGVLATVHEITAQIIGQRRNALLRDLGARSGEAKTAEQACAAAAAVFERYPHDVPFALLYLLERDGHTARLAAQAGIAPGGPESPPLVDLADPDATPWPVAEAVRSGTAQLVEDLGARFASVPRGPWSDPPHCALVLPVESHLPHDSAGVVVVGLSPRLELDASHRGFFHLVTTQLATSIANARAYEEERRRAESLAELDRAKTTFFSNVSHEFRTPLTLMLGPTEDLLAGAHGELAPAQRAQLELVRRNELRLHRLVNALLEFSRIEAGRVQAWFEPAELGELTRQIASAFQSATERAGLDFRVDCPPVSEPVYIDPDMWEQIVLNLLSNALKFTFDGTIAVALRCTEGEVVLEVRDTGVGVRAEDVPRLFERFHRIEGTRARTHEGSGIGLALVHELVRLHGGTITAQSTFGEGTTFTVAIPTGSAHLPPDRLGPRPSPELAPARAATFVEEAMRWLPDSAARTPVPEADAPGEARDPRASPPEKDGEAQILIADDNADMRDYLCRILGGRWSVDVVSDGQAALQAARRRPPELIITDVMMPGLDGFGLLRELRADPRLKAIPVLMLSARSGEDSRAIGIEAGADDYLVKPFSARELVARVNTHLKLARAQATVDRQWQEWMTILRQAPFAISLVRMPERRYEFVNDVHVAITGRDLTGLTLDEAYAGSWSDEIEALRKRQDDMFTASGTVFVPEVPWRASDGTTRYFSAAGRPWIGADGARQGVIALSIDVTDQVVAREREHAINEQTRRSEVALRRAVALREEFLTIASHELRTPLTTLGLQAEALVRAMQDAPPDSPPVERWARRAEKMQSQAARLEQLIEAMLEVAGLEGTGFPFQPEDCDLAGVVAAVVARFRGESKQASRLLTLRAEPVPGRWDKKRVDQLLTQLISNALKFGEDKPIEVAVGAAGGRARLSVRDRGIGIAPEDHARIFGRFERAVPSEHFGGLGVGLWIVAELARAMKGTVRVESAPGAGATFIVDLPGAS